MPHSVTFEQKRIEKRTRPGATSASSKALPEDRPAMAYGSSSVSAERRSRFNTSRTCTGVRWLLGSLLLTWLSACESGAGSTGDAPPDSAFDAATLDADAAAADVDGAPADAEMAPPMRIVLAGRPVDCGRLTVHAVEGSAELVLSPAVDLEVRLGESTLEVTDVGATGQVTLEPEPDASELRVRRAGETLCRAFVRDARDSVAARRVLLAASTRAPHVAVAERTGAISELVGGFPLSSAGSERDALESFLEEHAAALEAPVDQLTFVGTRGTGTEVIHRYQQTVGGLPVAGAELVIATGPGRMIRRISSSLLPNAAEPPTLVRDEATLRELLGSEDVLSVTAMVYDPVALMGRDRPGARPVWLAETAGARILVDDESGTEILRVSTNVEVDVEVHDGTFESGVPMVGGAFEMMSHRVVLSGPQGGSPSGEPRWSEDATIWSYLASIAGWIDTRHGHSGWNTVQDFQPSLATGAPVLEAETVRALVLPDFTTGAWFPRAGYMVFGRTAYIDHPDVHCHEYGHAMNSSLQRPGLLGPGPWHRTIMEASADAFTIACERNVFPEGDLWALAETVRSFRETADYEILVPDSEANLGEGAAAYAATRVLTHAIFRAATVHGWSLDRGFDRLVWELLGSNPKTYPTIRDSWLATASDWAKEGLHGVTEADVCAMARGFEDVGLDGSYGAGAAAADDALCDPPVQGSDERTCWCRCSDGLHWDSSASACVACGEGERWDSAMEACVCDEEAGDVPVLVGTDCPGAGADVDFEALRSEVEALHDPASLMLTAEIPYDPDPSFPGYESGPCGAVTYELPVPCDGFRDYTAWRLGGAVAVFRVPDGLPGAFNRWVHNPGYRAEGMMDPSYTHPAKTHIVSCSGGGAFEGCSFGTYGEDRESLTICDRARNDTEPGPPQPGPGAYDGRIRAFPVHRREEPDTRFPPGFRECFDRVRLAAQGGGIPVACQPDDGLEHGSIFIGFQAVQPACE